MQSVTKEFSVLLLDFGGVCSLYPVELHRHTEASFGLPRGSLTWLGPVAPDTDPLWQELLAGRVTERGYWDRRVAEIGEAVGRSLSVRDYMSNCYSLPEAEIIRPEAVEVVSAARQAGMKIGDPDQRFGSVRRPRVHGQNQFLPAHRFHDRRVARRHS